MQKMTIEERLANLESIAGEAQAQSTVALLLAQRLVVTAAGQQRMPAAFIDSIEQDCRSWIAAVDGDPKTAIVAAQMRELLTRVLDFARAAFRPKN